MKCFNCPETNSLMQYLDTHICESCYTLLGNNECGSSTRLHDQYLKSNGKTMIICIDGTDGTGKTTLVEKLRKEFPYHTFLDRGIPTFMVMQELNKKDEYKNDPVFMQELKLADKFFGTPADLTIVLRCPSLYCIQRLANKDPDNFWHQKKRLNDSDEQYKIVAIQHHWQQVDSGFAADHVFKQVVDLINSLEK